MAGKKKNEGQEKKPRTKKVKSTDLAITLRGAESVDPGLVDEVVSRINSVHQAKGLETARTVAECVIDVFFDGKPENFFARGSKHMSFEALKEREDLHVSYQFVWNACAVYDQLRKLPKDIAEALPLSHHKMLLPIKNEEKKRELAELAVGDKLTKREFEERVREVRAETKDESKLGRPPLPAFAKAFGKLKHVVALAESEEVAEGSFAHFTKKEAREMLTSLERDLAVLAEIGTRVRALAEA